MCLYVPYPPDIVMKYTRSEKRLPSAHAQGSGVIISTRDNNMNRNHHRMRSNSPELKRRTPRGQKIAPHLRQAKQKKLCTGRAMQLMVKLMRSALCHRHTYLSLLAHSHSGDRRARKARRAPRLARFDGHIGQIDVRTPFGFQGQTKGVARANARFQDNASESGNNRFSRYASYARN